MEGNVMLILPILFPVIMGILMLTVRNFRTNRKNLLGIVTVSLVGDTVLTAAALAFGGNGLKLWQLTESMAIEFRGILFP